MARILMIMPPFTGHINPALSVAAELEKLGHEVAWAVHHDMAGDIFPPQAKIFSLPNEPSFQSLQERSQHVRGLESVRFLYEEFCLPLARLSLAPLEKVVREYRPDFIVCDHQMMAGALVARQLDIPWVTLATTTASILKVWHVVDDWVIAQLHELQQSYGSKQIIERPDFSPLGVIVFSSDDLLGNTHDRFPATYHFVGPAISHRPKTIDFPWERLNPEAPKLLVSMGTISRDRSLRFYETLMEALADLPVQVVMVAPEVLRDKAPANFIVQTRVPQLELLPKMSAVLCHAGHNTVCESLHNGLPLIVAPIRDDQPIIARQVTDAGAGLFLRFGKASAATMRETVLRILNEPEFRQNARRLAKSFEHLGGAQQAAGIIEGYLVAAQQPA